MAAGAAAAQPTPLGLWRTFDDATGEAKAEIRIVERPGAGGGAAAALSGRIERPLRTFASDVCVPCTDDRKNQPVVGLEVIRGGQPTADGARWEGGRILDPENGKEYRLTLQPTDGGARLRVRGYLGPFFRTQTWVRVAPP